MEKKRIVYLEWKRDSLIFYDKNEKRLGVFDTQRIGEERRY